MDLRPSLGAQEAVHRTCVKKTKPYVFLEGKCVFKRKSYLEFQLEKLRKNHQLLAL